MGNKMAMSTKFVWFVPCAFFLTLLLAIGDGHCSQYRPISLDFVKNAVHTELPIMMDEQNEVKDYTNHTVVKILEKDIHLLFDAKNTNTSRDPDQEHEILWYDTSNQNSSYAYVRLGPQASHRVKRDINDHRSAQFVTENLQSWINRPTRFMREATSRSNQVFQPLPPYASTASASEIDEEEEEDAVGTNFRPEALMSASSKVERHYSKIVPSIVLNQYHPLAHVHNFLYQVEKKTPGVTTFNIGKTHEGRDIAAIEIMNNPNDPRFIWVDGCTHAREWVTVTTIMYMIEQIILEKIPINIILVPVLNVDGYVYTWTKDRLWRKNRRPYVSSRLARHSVPDRCTGVDLNRNYDINFGGEGSSDNPCSLLYQGPSPFSEPEVKAASDILSKHRDRIHMTLSLHSFNQLWACPNAYTKASTPDYDHHMNVLRSVRRAVYNTNKADYDIGPLGQRLYLGSGFMLDWIYHKLGIRDAYLVELRDKGHYGFILPVDQIWPTATETWNGFKAAVKVIFKL